tara:strand:- start:210 stop:782 length:573 start_codon:yes stop_codon:yes gene_type:complete
MSRFKLEKTPIDDLFIITRIPLSDERGYLERLFCKSDLENYFEEKSIIQINHTSTSGKGSVRGLHYQNPPYCETKVVSCLKGRIFDVAVDIRKDSPTFLKYFGIELTDKNFTSLLIPEGFAHGFQVLDDECELIYFHTCEYAPNFESGIDAYDPAINIKWPIEISFRSPRDSSHDRINDNFYGIDLSEMS